MKKSIVAVLLIIAGTGMLTSCSKSKDVAPTAAAIEKNTSPFKKDIGTAD